MNAITPGEVETLRPLLPVGYDAGVQAYQRSIMRDLDSANLRDKVGAFAIMFEKLSLIRGEATSRTESRDLTNDLNDHETEILGEAIRSELARRQHQDAEEPAVESAAPTGAETTAG